MIESIAQFIEPVFRQVVIASGIASVFFVLSFITIKILRVRNVVLIYNVYLIGVTSFLVVPLIASIVSITPIKKPHFNFSPILPRVEDLQTSGTTIQEFSPGMKGKYGVSSPRVELKYINKREEIQGIPAKVRLATLMVIGGKYLSVIWLLGSLCFLSLLAFNVARLGTIRKKAKFLKHIDPREFGFPLPNTALFTSNQINSPATISIWKTEILLPEEILKDTTEKDMKYILCHELSHIFRKDFLINLIQNIFVSFNFFNPIFWILNKKLNTLRENICDNWVLSKYSDKKGYASLLLNCMERFHQKGMNMEPAVGIFRTHSQTGTRIHRILISSTLHTVISSRVVWVSMVLFLSLFLVAGWIYAGAEKTKREILSNPMELSHVDNTAEGKRSLGASGHAVLFERPGDVRFVEAVHIFASRYGYPEAPNEDFHLYLLNDKQQVLADLRYPYGIIDRGDLRWYTLTTPSIEVTNHFYVALSFNPHKTKGIYLGLDDSVEQSHSLAGLPGSGFKKIEESHDWMVKVYLSRQLSGQKVLQQSSDWKPLQIPNDNKLNEAQRLYLDWTEQKFGDFESHYANMGEEEKTSSEKKWLEQIEKGSGREVIPAINGLAAIRSRKAVPALLRIAAERREKDNRDRWMAVRALGLIGDDSVVPELVHLTYHYNQNTRFWAQISLVRLTGQNFGRDVAAWRQWWQERGGKPQISDETVTWTTRSDWANPEVQETSDREFIEKVKSEDMGTGH